MNINKAQVGSSITIAGIMLLLISMNINSKTNEILQCQHDYTVVLPSTLPNQKNLNWHRSQERYLSPYRLNQQINNSLNQYTVIDVRPKQLFNNYHIRGAFNLPKLQLITKSLFKRKNIVLVGHGNDYRYLENFHQQLISKGFKQVQILDGGMNFWKSKITSKKLSTNEYSLNNIDKLLSGDRTNWKIVDTTKNLNITKHLSNIISIDDKEVLYNPDSLVKSLTNNNKLIPNILLVLNATHNKQQVFNLWQSKFNMNIYLISADKMSIAVSEPYQQQKFISSRKRIDGKKITCPL